MSRAQRKIGKKMRGRVGRKWRVMAIVAVSVASCDSLWSPFLMERETVREMGIPDGSMVQDMAVGSDGGAVADMTVGEVRPNLVLIRKGSFQMGSPTTESGRNPVSEQDHPVTLTTDFWMAESEVTQRQYRNLTGSSPSYFKGDDLPVEQVSWYDAVAYCNALSIKEGLQPCYQINGMTVGWGDGLKCTGYRLPTEAEWEYAAHPPSGSRTVYAGSDTVDGVAWYIGNSGNTTHAVKTKTANGRGLYDLSGNVFEWVWDWYQSNYEALPATDPIGPTTGASRVIRGGSWDYPASDSRVAGRQLHAHGSRLLPRLSHCEV
jgi:formylglycine-generating enzyme required for sulfatase activity